MEDDDIEILDIFDNNKKQEPVTPVVTRVSRLERQEEPIMQKKSTGKSVKKKRKVKAGAFQKLFC